MTEGFKMFIYVNEVKSHVARTARYVGRRYPGLSFMNSLSTYGTVRQGPLKKWTEHSILVISTCGLLKTPCNFALTKSFFIKTKKIPF